MPEIEFRLYMDICLPCCGAKGGFSIAGRTAEEATSRVRDVLAEVQHRHRCWLAAKGTGLGLVSPEVIAAENREQTDAKAEPIGLRQLAVGDRVMLREDWPDITRVPPGPRRGTSGKVEHVEFGWARVKFDGDDRPFFVGAHSQRVIILDRGVAQG